MFWTITLLTRHLYGCHETYTLPQVIVIEACGVVGALAYTFSDTFWFSAVESEVYAFSSFLTALVFWLILHWEEEADHPQIDRWLILTAYIIGLSVGVHHHVSTLSTECIKAPFNFRIVSDFVVIRNHLPLVSECLCVRHGSYLSVLTSL